MKIEMLPALLNRLKGERTGLDRWEFTAKKMRAGKRTASKQKKKMRKMRQLSKRRNK